MFEKKYTLDEKLHQMAKLKKLFNEYTNAINSGKLTPKKEREVRFDMNQIGDQITAIVDAPEND